MEKEKQLNLYQKLQKVRVELQNSKLKKSGKNTFSKYEYFELGDFLPKVNELCEKYNLSTIFQFTKEQADLIIIDVDDTEMHYKQGYHDAVEKACNIFCHTGCPHKTDSYNCLNDKCDTWKIFRRMMEE